MKIYKTTILRIKNEDTGETWTEAKRYPVALRCDYSGWTIEDACPSYDCDYGSIDPCFGSPDEEGSFAEKYNIDMFEFLSQPYYFCDDSHAGNVIGNQEHQMLKELAENIDEFPNLESALRHFRVRAAQKLIDDGIINPEDLIEDEIAAIERKQFGLE